MGKSRLNRNCVPVERIQFIADDYFGRYVMKQTIPLEAFRRRTSPIDIERTMIAALRESSTFDIPFEHIPRKSMHYIMKLHVHPQTQVLKCS